MPILQIWKLRLRGFQMLTLLELGSYLQRIQLQPSNSKHHAFFCPVRGREVSGPAFQWGGIER